MNTYEQAVEMAKILNEKKGENIKVLEITDVSSLADYMVIANGTSSTHVKSLAEELEYQMGEMGYSVSHIEGYRSNSWILLDYVDIIVHVFSEEAREFYDLERLWQDGKELDISKYID